MTLHRNPYIAACLGLLLTSACNYFDGELEALIPDESVGNPDGMLLGANFCDDPDSVPVREPDDLFLDVATTGLSDDFSDLSSCGIPRTLDGRDVFFRAHLTAGQRYHFHARAEEGQDLAVYLLSSCDERTCSGAVDDCPAGTDEHFSFVPRTAGTYFLGIDGIGDGSTSSPPAKLLATQPVCGDGIQQHSEVCEDGNRTAGDGCDENCRAELDDGATEMEPNGDPYGANVIGIPVGDAATIRASLGGPCDSDYFSVSVPEGASIAATMLTEAGAACTEAAPVLMRLLDDRLALLEDATGEDGECPTLQSSPLSGGEYFVRMRTSEVVAPFGYQLRLEVLEPTP